MTSRSLHRLLGDSARPDPAAVAVRGDAGCLTYGELDRRSSALAAALAGGGVEPGDRVGVHLDKSPEAVVAIFGALKAGAAYVPIDPDMPATRAALLVDDCRMKGIVSTTARLDSLRAAVPEGLGSLACVVLAELEGERPRAPWCEVAWSEALAAAPGVDGASASEADLAYILYTSGSTGRPKGVMLTHGNALAFVDWARQTFAVSAADRVASHAPLHFDLSVFDLFATIAAGGTVVLVPRSASVLPRSLADFIADEQISVCYSVPSVLTRLVRHGQLERHDYPRLRTVLFAGEVFPVKYLRQLQQLLPGRRFANLYGPTETNVCTWYEVPVLDPERTEPLSIGRPCAGSRVLILDEAGAAVPPADEGELCVHGPTVMRGYWGDLEKTHARLVPCVHLAGERVYHTGDRARQEADGTFTYLGRVDDMIKSRGYRIELGEIEAALYGHPDIEEAAVVPVPDDEVGNRIEAYLVPHDGAALPRVAVRAFCATRLPKYMVPDTFQVCPSLPRTSTGKVDRARLRQESAS